MSRLYDLKVNSRECILGLDDDRIYFGWKFNTAASGVVQKSCQVRQTDESAYFRYDGEKLEPAARYYWSVEAVDNHDCVYFGESWFETGLKGCSCSVWDGAQFIGSPYDSVNTDSLADYTVSSHISVGRSERTGLAFNVRDKDNYMSIELAFASGKCFVNRFNDAAWTDAVPYSVKLGNADGYSFDASSLAVYDEKKDEFYLKSGNSKQEFNLVAEGIRKMALLWQLVKNGTLEKGSVLFWDEPEANINPLYISIIVDMLLELQRKEVQIFIATHDYMLASYFEVRKKERDDILYHSLSHNKENMLLEYEKSDRFSNLKNNRIIDAFNNLLNEIYNMEV